MLGITVDANMKMNFHVTVGPKSLINQLNLRLRALQKLVKVSDFKFSMQLANSIFHSKLLYGIEVWGLCPKYIIKKVQVLQNKAARIVQGIGARKLDTSTLIKNMNWLQIQELISYRISCLIHQIVYTQKPEYLHKILIANNSINTRSNLGNKLGTKPKNIGKSQYTKNQFCSKAYNIYNLIPSIITSIENKALFKKYLKRYLLNNNDLPDSKIYKVAGLQTGL